MAVKEAVSWRIKVSKETDASLRSYLNARGMKKGDLSKFVERALAAAIFQNMVAEIHARNRYADAAQIEAEIEEAIREVRAERRSRS